MDLTGRAVVVTGSGRGLGRGYAEALGAAGASVVVNDLDQAVVDEAVAAVEAAGGKAVGVTAPVGSSETAEALVAAAVDAVRSARRDGHERGDPARPGAVEDVR